MSLWGLPIWFHLIKSTAPCSLLLKYKALKICIILLYSTPPLIYLNYISRPSVGAWNQGEYQTCQALCCMYWLEVQRSGPEYRAETVVDVQVLFWTMIRNGITQGVKGDSEKLQFWDIRLTSRSQLRDQERPGSEEPAKPVCITS